MAKTDFAYPKGELDMNVKRLRHLIEVLERVEQEKLPFDMATWARVSRDKTVCGTAACAAGHAALDPTFQAEGFGLKNDYDVIFESFSKLKQYVPKHGNIHEQPIVFFQEDEGWGAIMSFFDLEWGDAGYIFGAGAYHPYKDTQPRQVIDHINNLITIANPSATD